MMQVLIVDDEAPVRRLLGRWVESERASVVEASSAEEGLAMVTADDPPAVALCDLRLPRRNGLWLAEQLRAAHPETAVVMTTGVHEFDVAVTSLQAGVVDYLVKPFSRARMVEALHRAFFMHTSRRALTEMPRELEALRAQVTEALVELELTASTSVDAMLAMLQTRDPGAHGQAHRVARLAVNLALVLHVGEPALSDIERAALLHNLGRLAMPDELLARSRTLASAADRAMLCAYPLHGYAMLKNVPFLAGATRIAVASHERYDGTGFPHGLRGDALPLGARIIGVARAYDELVSGGGNAPIMPIDAVEIVSTERAAEFDPRVLDALRMLHPAGHSACSAPAARHTPRDAGTTGAG